MKGINIKTGIMEDFDPKIFTKGISPMDKIKFIQDLPQHEQRSPEWFEQRKDRLTSSTAGSVLDICPYDKPVEILFKKCGHSKPFVGNVATLHGQRWEDPAILVYMKLMGKTNYDFGLIDFEAMNPIRVFHKNDTKMDIRWMAGSPDGIAVDNENKEDLVLLEVKCPYRRKLIHGEIPDYYLGQVQLNMAIFDIDKCDFIEYILKKGNKPVEINIVRIHRDHRWFEENVPILDKMWRDILKWRKLDIKDHPDYEEFAYKPGDEKPKSVPKFIESYEKESLSLTFKHGMFR